MNVYGRVRLLDALSMAANLRLFSTSAARSWRVKSGWAQPGLQLIPGVLDSLQGDSYLTENVYCLVLFI